MCGIFGRISSGNVVPSILEALQTLDYRGYDSPGLGCITPDGIAVFRQVGEAAKLLEQLRHCPVGMPQACCGIGHTRWATHGDPTERNAHPHQSMNGRVAVVHNGQIDNYAQLRHDLEMEGFVFVSETDTEVLPNLIQRELVRGAHSIEDAVARALEYVEGAYAIAVISQDYPDQIIAARNSSPLVAGLCQDGGLVVASDEAAIAKLTRSVLSVGNGEIVSLSLQNGLHVRGRMESETAQRMQVPTVSPEDLDLGGYATVTEREIMTQPATLGRTIRGRVHTATHSVRLGGLERVLPRIRDSRSILILACGTSYYAGLAAKALIESLARIPVRVEMASEFIYCNPIVGHQDVVIGISQSGETMDTIKALELAKSRGALVLGITNRVGSAIASLVDAGVYLQVGPEFGVASTKAFSAQVTVLAMIASLLAESRRSVDQTRVWRLIDGLAHIPEYLAQSLECRAQVAGLAERYKGARRFIFIARGFGVPLAYEGALKLKELTYIDAMAYPAGELKHGPLALIEEGVPVVCIVPNDPVLRTRMLTNMHEVQARGGHIIAVTSSDEGLQGVATCCILIPLVPDELVPVVGAPVLQLLALKLAECRGLNIDKPRNLAKSVTTE